MEVEERNKYIELGLEEMHFHSSIGYYEEEKVLKNEFIVNIMVRLKDLPKDDDIETTVNYERLYGIVNLVFKESYNLIETAAKEIVDTCKSTWPGILSIELTIKKVGPIAGSKHGNSIIRIKEIFD